MSTQPNRRASGGLIDREKTVRFRFDGRDFTGHPGDTLASALLANGEHMVARGFKYHRPRGIFGAGSEDPTALVQIGGDATRTDPNTRVTEQEIYQGLEARAQNVWPSLRYDVGAINDVFSAFLPAGFYYKTFMGPLGNWMAFEPFIRKAAGMGVAPDGPDPDRYETVNRHCDVLVIGAGPAGLMAALTAAKSGARVILAEESAHVGGRLTSIDPDYTRISGKAPARWAGDVADDLADMDNVTVLTRTAAFGYYAQNFVGLWERVADHLAPADRAANLPRQRVWRIRAKEVVLATGSVERPLVFHENDRPGIMLAGAARTFVHRYGVVPGRRVLVFANNDSAWEAAFDLQKAGATISGIVDLRRDIDGALLGQAAERGIGIHPGAAIVGTSGAQRVSGAKVRRLSGEGSPGNPAVEGAVTSIECDLLAVSGGWMPNVALFSQSRGKLAFDEDLSAFKPGQSWQNERSAGSAAAVFDLAGCLKSGAQAGADAAKKAGFTVTAGRMPKIEGGERVQGTPRVLPEIPSGRPKHKVRAWIDLQDDVTTKDIRLALQEGYDSIEHAKRYTTTGMGTDQGKVANMNAFALVADALGKPVWQVGTTTYRQPWKPVTFGAIAGQHVGAHFHPRRTTPAHAWHAENGAVFEPVGDWLRARAYLRSGESFDDAVQRESKAAREHVAVLDASTLGKIDIRGKDARTFLNRVYTNAWSKLAPGKARYGLMLGEDGMVMDDGVTACIADDHFHMTTTTGGAASVLTHLEDYLQTEWTDLEVYLTTVTEQWSVASLSGPDSWRVVADLCEGIDPDPEMFKFMQFADATIDGVPVRVFRISFTGALAYEINIAADYGHWLWTRVIEAGRKYAIQPYGTEAMHLLRAEKGFIIVGQETDGTMTPGDLRMDWIVNDKKGDFIGKRSLNRADTARDDRKQLVGLLTDDPELMLEEGAHIIATATEPAPPVPMLGHITSSYVSPNLGRSIALAVVKSGGDRIGERLWVTRRDGAPIPVKVTETDFLHLRETGDV